MLQLERTAMAINKYYKGKVCVGAALLSRSFANYPQWELDGLRDSYMKENGRYFPLLFELHKQKRFFIAHELQP
jgi:hypothetical protein